jgi:protein phosphatase
MPIVSAGIKHQGRVRPHNEDSFLEARDLGLFAVADGVESEPCGEVASAMAVKTLREVVAAIDLDKDSTPPFEYAKGIPLEARALKFSFREVNRRLFEAAGRDPKCKGMCTTLSAVWFRAGRAFIANVGDSRVYIVRHGRIQQLTHDHTSLAQTRADEVLQMEIEMLTPVSEHELSRAVGLNADLEVQLAAGTPKPGDLFILCTDGLYGPLRDFEIMEAAKSAPPETAVKKLVALANEKSGKDNIAVVIVQP